MAGFFPYPHTPHIAWLGSGHPRSDKVLSPEAAHELLSHELLAEEKVDGANVGFSIDDDGVLRAQSRGDYLAIDHLHGQWRPLGQWLTPRVQELSEALFPDLMLFGEWCYAVHSITYTRLPDWFLAFDVYDRSRGEFWNSARRTQFAARLGLAVVPELERGHFDLRRLEALIGRSMLRDGEGEGIYLRRENESRLLARAKLVHPHFIQAIGRHWSTQRLKANKLKSGL